MVIGYREEQPMKTPSIDVTPSGTVIDTKEKHTFNTTCPIDITPSGTVIDTTEVQSLQVYSLIDVTLSGIVIDTREDQYSKAPKIQARHAH